MDTSRRSVAYLLVSSTRQEADSRRLAILEHAHRHHSRVEDFIEATASEEASKKHRRLDEVVAALRPAYGLIVSELARVGRSLGQVVAILERLAKAEVPSRP